MERNIQQTKTIDSKGRLTLGAEFANRTVLVEKRGEEWVLKLARVIPEREAWLYENHEALNSLRNGLRQAQKREFAVEPPDLDSALSFIEEIPNRE